MSTTFRVPVRTTRARRVQGWASLRILIAVIAFGLAAGVAPPARAGRDCEAEPVDADRMARSLALAERTARALDASGARVVLLARAGKNLDRYGLRWSHMGFAYRDGEAGGLGRWRVVHLLNECGTDRSAIWRQGLGEFFLDDPFRYEAGYQVPAPEVQARLAPLLADDRAAVVLHHQPYNMVAYPWSRQYQQSNQWTIETLARAVDPAAADRERAQAWLRLHDYAPTVLRLGMLTRLGARVASANVAFDDHPNDQRFADRIATVTVDSVFDWLPRAGFAAPAAVVR